MHNNRPKKLYFSRFVLVCAFVTTPAHLLASDRQGSLKQCQAIANKIENLMTEEEQGEALSKWIHGKENEKT